MHISCRNGLDMHINVILHQMLSKSLVMQNACRTRCVREESLACPALSTVPNEHACTRTRGRRAWGDGKGRVATPARRRGHAHRHGRPLSVALLHMRSLHTPCRNDRRSRALGRYEQGARVCLSLSCGPRRLNEDAQCGQTWNWRGRCGTSGATIERSVEPVTARMLVAQDGQQQCAPSGQRWGKRSSCSRQGRRHAPQQRIAPCRR